MQDHQQKVNEIIIGQLEKFTLAFKDFIIVSRGFLSNAITIVVPLMLNGLHPNMGQ